MTFVDDSGSVSEVGSAMRTGCWGRYPRPGWSARRTLRRLQDGPHGGPYVAMAACLVIASVASAHEGLRAQIDAVTAQLDGHQGNARLHIKRGDLHRLHADWDAALADYEVAGRLDRADDYILFARGRTLVEADRSKAALIPLDRFLLSHPSHGLAHLSRARALAKLSRYAQAGETYNRAIEHLDNLQPDHFLERAKFQVAAGEDHLSDAILGLDEGIKILGQVVSLQLYAIELELRLGHGNAALGRLDQLLLRAKRKEKWLARRGKIFAQMKRWTEASEAYKQTLAAIEALPARHRQVAATRALEEAVHTALRGLDNLSAGGAD